jgi:hypothetical protein
MATSGDVLTQAGMKILESSITYYMLLMRVISHGTDEDPAEILL